MLGDGKAILKLDPLAALHDLECVDPGLQLPRVNQ